MRHRQAIAVAALLLALPAALSAQRKSARRSTKSAAAGAAASQRGATSDRQPEWRVQLTRAQLKEQLGGAELYSVEFLNRRVGWAVGGHSKSTIAFQTTDGGRSWDRLQFLDGGSGDYLKFVRFADANNGWIGGTHHLFHTSDGGANWEPMDLPDKLHGGWGNTAVTFGPGAIMIGADGGVVRVTTDGGTTWQSVRLAASGSKNITGVAHVGGQRFVATVEVSNPRQGAIMLSDDLGQSWRIVAEATTHFRGVTFLDDRHGVAVGDEIASWTDDGGETWHRAIAAGKRFAVRYVDDHTLVSAGERPDISLSTDGGRSWRPFGGPGTYYALTDISVVDPGWMYATGGYGDNQLYHYVDPRVHPVLASSDFALPVRLRASGGSELRPGLYHIALAYDEDSTVLRFGRTGTADADTTGWSSRTDSTTADGRGSSGAEAARGDATSTGGETIAAAESSARDAISVPVTSTFEKVTLDASGQGPRYRLSLEPTATGVGIIIDAMVRPPLLVRRALAAARTGDSSTVTLAKTNPGSIVRGISKAGQRAKDAVDNGQVDPRKVAARLHDARGPVPAMYRVKVRYDLQVVKAPTSP